MLDMQEVLEHTQKAKDSLGKEVDGFDEENNRLVTNHCLTPMTSLPPDRLKAKFDSLIVNQHLA